MCEIIKTEGKSSGGGGLASALVVVMVAMVLAAAATSIVAALTTLIHVLTFAIPVALAALVAVEVWMAKHHRRGLVQLAWRRTRVLPPQQQPRMELDQGGMHLHLHGVSPEEVAEILAQQRDSLPWHGDERIRR